MKKGRRRPQGSSSGTHTQPEEKERIGTITSTRTAGGITVTKAASLAVIALALLYKSPYSASSSELSNDVGIVSTSTVIGTSRATDGYKSSIYADLFEDWCVDCSAVTVRETEATSRGLYATRNIAKGEIVAKTRHEDISNDALNKYPMLHSLVDKALAKHEHKHRQASLVNRSKILTILQFLLLASQDLPRWNSYLSSLPQESARNLYPYWTTEERHCIVPRPGSKLEILFDDFHKYTAVMADLREQFQPLASISLEQIEWAYLTYKTRGFSTHLVPVMDLANHHPPRAHPAFMKHATQGERFGTATFIATRDIQAGEEIFNDYGVLSSVSTAEQYGFVEDNPSYFEVPSIHLDLLESRNTKNEPLCTQTPVYFFGKVTEQLVEAGKRDNGTGGYSRYFKAFMPTEKAYACLSVLLQSQDDTRIAAYVASKLAIDQQRYQAMADAASCQPGTDDGGGMHLIHQANLAMARALEGALEAANEAATSQGRIKYPAIPTYIRR